MAQQAKAVGWEEKVARAVKALAATEEGKWVSTWIGIGAAKTYLIKELSME